MTTIATTKEAANNLQTTTFVSISMKTIRLGTLTKRPIKENLARGRGQTLIARNGQATTRIPQAHHGGMVPARLSFQAQSQQIWGPICVTKKTHHLLSSSRWLLKWLKSKAGRTRPRARSRTTTPLTCQEPMEPNQAKILVLKPLELGVPRTALHTEQES